MPTTCLFCNASLQVVKMLRFNGTRVPQDYEIRFQLALWAFRHCRVYCPTAKVCTNLCSVLCLRVCVFSTVDFGRAHNSCRCGPSGTATPTAKQPR
jgi:hypothetical protein